MVYQQLQAKLFVKRSRASTPWFIRATSTITEKYPKSIREGEMMSWTTGQLQTRRPKLVRIGRYAGVFKNFRGRYSKAHLWWLVRRRRSKPERKPQAKEIYQKRREPEDKFKERLRQLTRRWTEGTERRSRQLTSYEDDIKKLAPCWEIYKKRRKYHRARE